jgi:hypothetical protein
MNNLKVIHSLTLAISGLLCLAGLAGCATTKQTEQLLTQAGFRTRTPTTPEQQAIYEHLEAYQLQRTMVAKTPVYCYKDTKQGVVYVGDDKDYQKYQQLGWEQAVEQEKLQAAQMNTDLSVQFAGWGPGMWWRDGQ